MSQSHDQATAPAGQGLLVVLAWAFVGIPLLWGMYETILNAMQLFR